LVRAYGFHGDLVAAQEAADLGIEIGRQAGDPWVVALVQLTLGASYVMAGQYVHGVKILPRAATVFRECSDTYGRTAARLWLALAFFHLDQTERLHAHVDRVLRAVEAHGYDHLFTRRALLGPPDNRMLVPMLLAARDQRTRPATVNRLLTGMGLPHVQVHPGYQLRVQMLGPFRVWRGTHEIETREWRRAKARNLFQLLLTFRGRMLQREEIVDILWPDIHPDAVQRDFKVALNALNKALEPHRPAGTDPAYVDRHATSYGLRRGADIWIDTEAFEELIERGDRHKTDLAARADVYQKALDLYHGDYVQEALYEDWASEERERLITLYLRTAEKLAALRLKQERHDETIDLCHKILAQDNCWEQAYRLMMTAYSRNGQHPQALRVYRECEETLHSELGTQPSVATQELYAQIASKNLDWNRVA
jgi:DNA-binding SARP family transcriptional activator